MIITTDELKRAVSQLEDGKFIIASIDTGLKKTDDYVIDGIIKYAEHPSRPDLWNYKIVIGKEVDD